MEEKRNTYRMVDTGEIYHTVGIDIFINNPAGFSNKTASLQNVSASNN